MVRQKIHPKRLRLIYPKENSESKLFLIEGIKNGKSGLKVLNPLIIHNSNVEYVDEILKLFEGEVQ
ncbi:MAG: hypothetical protein ACK5HL_03500 [Bacilli bacterium]